MFSLYRRKLPPTTMTGGELFCGAGEDGGGWLERERRNEEDQIEKEEEII